jgi:hypothetical protein
MHLPALHLRIAHSEDRRDEWIKCIKLIRHEGSYYVRALENAPLNEVERVLRPWINTNKNWQSGWAKSAAIRRQIANSAYWDWLGATTWNHDHMLTPMTPTFPKLVDGRSPRWRLGPKGTTILRDFTDSKGSMMELMIPPVARILNPVNEDDPRVITLEDNYLIGLSLQQR